MKVTLPPIGGSVENGSLEDDRFLYTRVILNHWAGMIMGGRLVKLHLKMIQHPVLEGVESSRIKNGRMGSPYSFYFGPWSFGGEGWVNIRGSLNLSRRSLLPTNIFQNQTDSFTEGITHQPEIQTIQTLRSIWNLTSGSSQGIFFSANDKWLTFWGSLI